MPAVSLKVKTKIPRFSINAKVLENVPAKVMRRVAEVGRSAILRGLERAKFLGTISSSEASRLITISAKENVAGVGVNRFYQRFVEEGLKETVLSYVQKAFGGKTAPPGELNFTWGPEGPEVGGKSLEQVASRALEQAEDKMFEIILSHIEKSL